MIETEDVIFLNLDALWTFRIALFGSVGEVTVVFVSRGGTSVVSSNCKATIHCSISPLVFSNSNKICAETEIYLSLLLVLMSGLWPGQAVVCCSCLQ